jgi:hypothetical protein
MKHTTALIVTIAAALLSACSADPAPPVTVEPTVEGKAFLDEYLSGLIGTAQQQPPAPTTWQDLLVPPALIGPGAQQPRGSVETSGQVLAPNAVDHG